MSIGTQQRKINIIPDYLLCIDFKNAFILDAKAPTQILRNSVHVEQAYSYAIHPEVRVPVYSLCNGRELVVYHISEIEPIFSCQIESIDENWDKLNAVIGPVGIQNPHLRDFLPDFGMRAKMTGVPPETLWVFMDSPLDNFMRVTDDLLTTFAKFNDNGTELRNFIRHIELSLRKLLSTRDEQLSKKMRELLSRNPFRIAIGDRLL